MARIFFLLTSDGNKPSGGMKQIYRQVDCLNELGFEAWVAHRESGFRCDWFANDTRVCGHSEVLLTAGDAVVLGEGAEYLPELPGIDRARKVCFNQNPYKLPHAFGGNSEAIQDWYANMAEAVICVSEHARTWLEQWWDTPVHRIRYSFDRPPFRFGSRKRRQIAVMPRKRGPEAAFVLEFLRVAGCLSGYRQATIDGVSEEDAARILTDSAVFMALGEREGFGMPAAEAMASGCVVVGYHGHGGREFWKPEFSHAVDDGDVVGFCSVLRDVLRKPDDELARQGRAASEFVLDQYSTEAEKLSIRKAWRGIMGSRVTVRSQRLGDVAAFVSTYDEGPYLERVLRWLVPQVGKVLVSESETTWNGAKGEPERATAGIVDGILEDMPEARDVLDYRVIGGNPGLAGAEKETSERNKALEVLQQEGFKWVWIVDSDEAYTDRDAQGLWRWFRSRLGPEVTGARCGMLTYWRSMTQRVEPPEPLRPNVIIRSDMRFRCIRHLRDESGIVDVPPDVCVMRHYSWAKEPWRAARKIETWGHAHQMVPGWFRDVFLAWRPGAAMSDLHPTDPPCYRAVVPCDAPVPESMADHPWLDVPVIEDEHTEMLRLNRSPDFASLSIAVVILNHGKPESADRLYEALSPVFDDLHLWDSGSPADRIPIHLTEAFANIYWTGAWNEAMRRFGDRDVIWVLGCDLELRAPAEMYRRAIETAHPFGCWSPSIQGRAHPFMLAENYGGGACSVLNVEGMALAASTRLTNEVRELVAGSQIGFGQDFWLCYRAREAGLRNIVDGRLSVYHPVEIGYSEKEAHDQMERAFGDKYGPDFRRKVFRYSQRFEENRMSVLELPGLGGGNGKEKASMADKVKVYTVDAHGAFGEFIFIVSQVDGVEPVILEKREGVPQNIGGVRIVNYGDEELARAVRDADLAFFSSVPDEQTKEDVRSFMRAGVPVVMSSRDNDGLVQHMVTGFLYEHSTWGIGWLNRLVNEPELRKQAGQRAAQRFGEGGTGSDVDAPEQEAGGPAAEVPSQGVVAPSAPEPQADRPVGMPPGMMGKMSEIAAQIQDRQAGRGQVVPAPLPQGQPSRAPTQTGQGPVPQVGPDGSEGPRHTVIMPTYHRDTEVVRRALDCVKAQTVEDWELLVCSDGERELLIEGLVDAQGDERIRYSNTPTRKENDYGNQVRAAKLAEARGEFVVFLDDDNMMMPEYLAVMSSAIEREQADWAICRCLHFGPLQPAVGQPPVVLVGVPPKLYYIDTLQMMFRREAIQAVGWDTSAGYYTDGVTAERLVNSGRKYATVPLTLAVHM